MWKALKEAGGTTTGWLRGCVDIWEGADLLRGKKDEENEEADVDVEKICQANLDVAAKIAGAPFVFPRCHHFLFFRREYSCFQ